MAEGSSGEDILLRVDADISRASAKIGGLGAELGRAFSGGRPGFGAPPSTPPEGFGRAAPGFSGRPSFPTGPRLERVEPFGPGAGVFDRFPDGTMRPSTPFSGGRPDVNPNRTGPWDRGRWDRGATAPRFGGPAGPDVMPGPTAGQRWGAAANLAGTGLLMAGGLASFAFTREGIDQQRIQLSSRYGPTVGQLGGLERHRLDADRIVAEREHRRELRLTQDMVAKGDIDRQSRLADIGRQESRQTRDVHRERTQLQHQYDDLVVEGQRREADRVQDLARIGQDWQVRQRDFGRQREDIGTQIGRFEQDAALRGARRGEDFQTEAASIARTGRYAAEDFATNWGRLGEARQDEAQDYQRGLGRIQRDRGRTQQDIAEETQERTRQTQGARADLGLSRLMNAISLGRAAESGDPLAVLGAIQQRRALARQGQELDLRGPDGLTARERRSNEARLQGYTDAEEDLALGSARRVRGLGQREEDLMTGGRRTEEALTERQRLLGQAQTRAGEDELIERQRVLADAGRDLIRSYENETTAARDVTRAVDQITTSWTRFTADAGTEVDRLNGRVGVLNETLRDITGDALGKRIEAEGNYRDLLGQIAERQTAENSAFAERDRAFREREQDLIRTRDEAIKSLEIQEKSAWAQLAMVFGFPLLFGGGTGQQAGILAGRAPGAASPAAGVAAGVLPAIGSAGLMAGALGIGSVAGGAVSGAVQGALGTPQAVQNQDGTAALIAKQLGLDPETAARLQRYAQRPGLAGIGPNGWLPEMALNWARFQNNPPNEEMKRYLAERGFAEGGIVHQPTLLVNARSGHPYGMMAERESEYIVNQRQMKDLQGGRERPITVQIVQNVSGNPDPATVRQLKVELEKTAHDVFDRILSGTGVS